MEMKTCTACKKSYPKTSENFPFKDKNKGYLQPKCRKCQREYMKKYRDNNRDKFLVSGRTFDRSPKGYYKKLKQSIRGNKVSITQDEFVEWYNSQPKKCFYCGFESKKSSADIWEWKIVWLEKWGILDSSR